MNFLSLGMRTLKLAESAKESAISNAADVKAGLIETLQLISVRETRDKTSYEEERKATQLKIDSIAELGNTAYNAVIAREMERAEKAFDIGLTYWEMAKRKMDQGPSERWYMLTVRPPPGTNIRTLVHTTESFVTAWRSSWEEYQYCYEQKGETEADMGIGCHMHMLIRTDKANYYPSHILRDAKRAWPYVAANCIQVDTLPTGARVGKAKAYIRGTKNHADKEASAALDPVWRAREGLLELYESGQVQPLSI